MLRDSDTQATLTLAFDLTDFDSDASMSVTVEQTALTAGGPATTGTVAITAIIESVTASISGTNPSPLLETNRSEERRGGEECDGVCRGRGGAGEF